MEVLVIVLDVAYLYQVMEQSSPLVRIQRLQVAHNGVMSKYTRMSVELGHRSVVILMVVLTVVVWGQVYQSLVMEQSLQLVFH